MHRSVFKRCPSRQWGEMHGEGIGVFPSSVFLIPRFSSLYSGPPGLCSLEQLTQQDSQERKGSASAKLALVRRRDSDVFRCGDQGLCLSCCVHQLLPTHGQAQGPTGPARLASGLGPGCLPRAQSCLPTQVTSVPQACPLSLHVICSCISLSEPSHWG